MSAGTIALLSIMAALAVLLILSLLVIYFATRARQLRRELDDVPDNAVVEGRVRERTKQALALHRQKLLDQQEAMEMMAKARKGQEERLEKLREIAVPFEDLVDRYTLGLHKPEFDLQDHADYTVALQKLREEQVQMVRDKKAIVSDTEWALGDSRNDGKKMVNRIMRLTLRAFNNECNLLMNKITNKNLESIKARICTAVDDFDQINENLTIFITDDYLDLKSREADLVAAELGQKMTEREELRRAQADEKREAVAQREMQTEINRLERNHKTTTERLARLRKQRETVRESEKQRLSEDIGRTEAELAENERQRSRLVPLDKVSKAGHVYIISNRASFTTSTVKIGLSRRFDPVEEIRSLVDENVPRPYDIHALIYSDDADELLGALTQVFAAKTGRTIDKAGGFFDISISDARDGLAHLLPDAPFDPCNLSSGETAGRAVGAATT